jgi:hypothetical protein
VIGGVADAGANQISRAVNIGVSVIGGVADTGVSAIGGVTDTSANLIGGAVRLGTIPIGGASMLGASQHQMIRDLPRLIILGANAMYMPIDPRQAQRYATSQY